jgi:RNA-directed DNA polymerase
MAIVLGEHLAPLLSPHCVHVKGHGGVKKAVRDVCHHLSSGSHVMKSDVRGYYATIDHMLLLDMLSEYITDRFVLRLLWQYLKRTVRYGENYRDVEKGISLGCPLSPLMAALFLKPMDDAMQDSGLFYVRFMDDWIVIAPSRWKLRKAVVKVNEILEGIKLEKHPDKTFIGRAERGFTFLGYYLTPWGLSVARETWNKMKKRIAQLYEQGADTVSIGQYVRRWLMWVTSRVSLSPEAIWHISLTAVHEGKCLPYICCIGPRSMAYHCIV